MLSASGEIDLKRPDDSPLLELANAQIRGGKGLQAIKRPSNVRSVYLPELRNIVPEMLQVFDAADPNLIVGKRDVTTVATQALFLMNNPFVLKQSDLLARRALGQQGLSPAARIDLVYRLTLGRVATDREKSDVAKYLADYRKALESGDHKGNPNQAAWASFCQTLFASGEFRYVY